MTKLHNEIKINAPVEKVWKILADLEQVQYYNPLVAHTKYVSENRLGIGATRHCDFKPKGFSKERVTEFKPQEVIGFEIIESSFPMVFTRWRTMLKPVDGGTLVSQDMEYQLKFGLLGSLMDVLIIRQKYGKILDDIFRGLKRYSETGK